VGKRFSDVLPPNAAYVIEGMLEAVRAGQRPRDVDYTLELHSETRWFNAQVSVLERADGQPQSVILVCRDVTRRKRAELLQQEQLRELREAQENLRVLRGLLTICASCKSIRSKEGDWVKVEAYIEANSEACFSHGLCRACIEKLYPEDELVQ
ncbi:MAG: PAS domain-containing protein, partial [Myxococcota bacterium]